MLKKLMEKRKLMRKKNGGFTLMELIVVIAILGFLAAMLVPKYTNFTDKAMGTAAAADARNILTVATSHYMDSNAMLSAADLQKAVGLVANKGKTLTLTGTVVTYKYERSGVTITATINIDDGNIKYALAGGTTDRLKRVEAGLGGEVSTSSGGGTP